MNEALFTSPTITAPEQPHTHAAFAPEHGDLLTEVEARMIELAGDRLTDPGAQMIHEHLGHGGKRLRAQLALGACQAFGGRALDALGWATAVELMHNASLVHDDIQDGDRTRRGHPALWVRYGTAQGINAGDLMLMLPFRALGQYPAPTQAALVQILAEYAERTVRGQIEELALAAPPDTSWSHYFRAVSGKTGTLFALPVRGAAEIAGVRGDAAGEIALAFSSIGVLYQMQNDLLDLFDEKGRGAQGSDISEGRRSAAVLSHLELHPEDATALLEVLDKPRAKTTPQDISETIDRLVQGGAARHLLNRIESFAAHSLASEALRVFPDIDRIARALVGSVLAPLQALKGAELE